MAGAALAEGLLARGEILRLCHAHRGGERQRSQNQQFHNAHSPLKPRNHFRHGSGGCTITLADSSTLESRFGSPMSVVMPAADQAVLARRDADRRRSAGDRAGRGRDLGRARDAALRIRRADRLQAIADGGGAAGDHRAGRGRAALLPRQRHPGGAARRGHLAVRRRAAAGRRRAARHGQVQPHPRDRLRQPRRGGRARRHQSRHQHGGRRPRASTTRPIRRRRSPAPSAATSRRIPAACIA